MNGHEPQEVRLIGRPALRTPMGWSDLRPGLTTALLAYLAVVDRWVTRDELLALFWPDSDEDRARGNLRPLLWRIGRDGLVTGFERRRTSVRWAVRTDLRSAHDAEAAGNAHAAWHHVRGELLEGFSLRAAPAFDDWLEPRRAEARAIRRWAGLILAEEATAAGDHDRAADVLATLHRHDPFDEPVVQALMGALTRRGSRGEALVVADAFERLCREELGVEPDAATRALAHAIRSRAPAANAPDGPRADPPAAFFGREQELARLDRLLRSSDRAVVVLTGPGGIGKSRLAAEAVRRHGSVAYWCAPPDLPTGTDLGATLTRYLLPIPPAVGDAWAALESFLRDTEAMIVLDGFEHLHAETPRLAALMRAAPGLRVLATSRTASGAPETVNLRVPGLVECGPALFASVARRRDPGFEPEVHDAAILAICAAVDHVPLAIELAASWIGILPCDGIARELGRDPAAMVSGRGGPAAGHGMDHVFERSWSLLDPGYRAPLTRLSVFRGAFSLDHAARVALAPLATVRALADASLVHGTDDGMLRLHDVVRAEAEARLEAEDAERARSAHLDVTIERARAVFDRIFTSVGDDRDHGLPLDGDLSAALAWSRESPLHAERHGVLLELACWAWRRAGRVEHALRWLAGRPEDALLDPTVAALLTYHRGHFLWMLGDVPEATRWHHRARDMAEAVGPAARFAAALAHSGLAHCALMRDEHASAAVHAAHAHVGFREADRPWFVAFARGLEARSRLELGELDVARTAISECIATFRSLDDAWGLGLFLHKAAEIALVSGDVAAALDRARESVHLLHRIGFAHALPAAQETLRVAEARRGEAAVAHRTGRDRAVPHVRIDEGARSG